MERVAGDGSPSGLVGFIDAVLEKKAPPAAATSATLLDGHRGSRRRGRSGALSAESTNTPGTGHSGATPHTKVGYPKFICFKRVSRAVESIKVRTCAREYVENFDRKMLNENFFVSALCLVYALFKEDTFCRRHYRIQDLLPVQFQQIYYNDVSATAHFYAYDM